MMRVLEMTALIVIWYVMVLGLSDLLMYYPFIHWDRIG